MWTRAADTEGVSAAAGYSAEAKSWSTLHSLQLGKREGLYNLTLEPKWQGTVEVMLTRNATASNSCHQMNWTPKQLFKLLFSWGFHPSGWLNVLIYLNQLIWLSMYLDQYPRESIPERSIKRTRVDQCSREVSLRDLSQEDASSNQPRATCLS